MKLASRSSKPEPSIGIATATKRSPKDGVSYCTTEVRWDKYKCRFQKLTLPSLGREVELAIAPKLPQGYKIQTHSTWREVNEELIERAKQAKNFEVLERIFQDCAALEKLIGSNLIHPYDVCDFKTPEGFDEWLELRVTNRKLQKMTLAEVVKQLPKPFHFQETVNICLVDGRQFEIPFGDAVPEELAGILLPEIKSITLEIRAKLDNWKEEYW